MTHLAIVGGGPLATYALERLAAHLSGRSGPAALAISLFDRDGHFGAGATHSATQCRTSYMNRVASQIAFAADESNCAARALLPPHARPTFYEWCQAMYLRTGEPRYQVAPNEIPLRHLHGEALAQRFAFYVEMLRAIDGVSVTLYAAEVVDLVPHADGRLQIITAGADLALPPADHALLVTGHADCHAFIVPRRSSHIRCPYPLDRQLSEQAIAPGTRVGMRGAGLSAIDALLHLSEGRGGCFLPDPGTGALRYLPSGREPEVIVMASPSGMFPACRPDNHKACDGSARSHAAHLHRGRFLTADAIETLRARVGRPALLSHGTQRQLDFATHVFPLMVLEMAWLYHATLLGPEAGRALEAVARPGCDAFLRAPGAERDAAVARLLAPLLRHAGLLEGKTIPFDWRRLFWPLDEGDAISGQRWRDSLLAWMAQDLQDAAEGNLRNPAKAACDGVWRDLRPVWSALLDFGGLTAASHREFMAQYFRLYTRMSNGTGRAPMQKLLALIGSGLVDVALGPGARVLPLAERAGFHMAGPLTGEERRVSVLIEGRVAPFDARAGTAPLYRALLQRGMVRLWANPGLDGGEAYIPGALDITPALHPLRADGSVEQRLTLAGAPTEGVLAFQLSAARPQADSAIFNRLSRWADELVTTPACDEALTP